MIAEVVLYFFFFSFFFSNGKRFVSAAQQKCKINKRETLESIALECTTYIALCFRKSRVFVFTRYQFVYSSSSTVDRCNRLTCPLPLNYISRLVYRCRRKISMLTNETNQRPFSRVHCFLLDVVSGCEIRSLQTVQGLDLIRAALQMSPIITAQLAHNKDGNKYVRRYGSFENGNKEIVELGKSSRRLVAVFFPSRGAKADVPKKRSYPLDRCSSNLSL